MLPRLVVDRAWRARASSVVVVLTMLAGSTLGAMTGGTALCGCEPLPSRTAPSHAARELPAYAGRAPDLFDDTIEPRAVGLGLDLDASSTPKGDAYFRERARASDIVVRARVATVTGKQDGPETAYQIGFKVLEPIGGRRPLGDEIAVRIDRSSPSFGVVKSLEGRLVGRTMIVFARAFLRDGGDQEVHIHVSPDTKEVAEAVHEAVILDEMGGGTTFTTPSTTTRSR